MKTPKSLFTLPLDASSARHAGCLNRTRRRVITGVFLMLALVSFGPNLLQSQTPPRSRMVGLGTLPGGLFPDSLATARHPWSASHFPVDRTAVRGLLMHNYAIAAVNTGMQPQSNTPPLPAKLH